MLSVDFGPQHEQHAHKHIHSMSTHIQTPIHTSKKKILLGKRSQETFHLVPHRSDSTPLPMAFFCLFFLSNKVIFLKTHHIFIKYSKFVIYVYACVACMYVCVPLPCTAHRVQKEKALHALEL